MERRKDKKKLKRERKWKRKRKGRRTTKWKSELKRERKVKRNNIASISFIDFDEQELAEVSWGSDKLMKRSSQEEIDGALKQSN
jgi:hypothetical protein